MSVPMRPNTDLELLLSNSVSGRLITCAVGRVAVVDAVPVGRAQHHVYRAEVAAKSRAAFIGDPGHVVDQKILCGEARLARKHQIAYLELAELHADAAAEHIVMADPCVFEKGSSVIALFGQDAVKVIGDVVRQRRRRQQFDQVGRLKIP